MCFGNQIWYSLVAVDNAEKKLNAGAQLQPIPIQTTKLSTNYTNSKLPLSPTFWATRTHLAFMAVVLFMSNVAMELCFQLASKWAKSLALTSTTFYNLFLTIFSSIRTWIVASSHVFQTFAMHWKVRVHYTKYAANCGYTPWAIKKEPTYFCL